MTAKDTYHPRKSRDRYIHVRVSDEDRARLIALSHARGSSGAEVIRALIEAAFHSHELAK